MASRSLLLDAKFPLVTELRCGTCFRKLGVANITGLDGRFELLCTRRSRQETCKTLNVYEGTPDGYFTHTFERLQDGG